MMKLLAYIFDTRINSVPFWIRNFNDYAIYAPKYLIDLYIKYLFKMSGIRWGIDRDKLCYKGYRLIESEKIEFRKK